MRFLASLLVCVLVLALDAGALAQPSGMRRGLSSAGLCGLEVTAFPTCARSVAVGATAGYGVLESVGTVPGIHHRFSGVLGLGVVPVSWLALALRFDGRIDRHPPDARGDDFTGTGDPRLLVRAGHALGRALSLGGELVLWFPGNDAPSFEPRATTVDLKGLLAYERSAFALLAHAGVRIDQSAESAPDIRRLRAGDRVALGLSDASALLLALGAATALGAHAQLFGEVSLDWLLGERAPPLRTSPMRATLGARRFFTPSLQGELAATVALSARPSFAPSAPLVPAEPRILVTLGVRYGHALDRPVVVAPPPVEPPRPVAPPPPPPRVTVGGALVDAAGAPVPDVKVHLRSGDDDREVITDGEGRYTFLEVLPGLAELEASAPGFAPQRWQLDVRPGMQPAPARTLSPQGETGTLRLLTRTFRSEPLAAAVTVRDARGRKVTSGQTDPQGLLEFDLRPGRYIVMISARGYRTLRREVQIERYGVAILNVDMRTR